MQDRLWTHMPAIYASTRAYMQVLLLVQNELSPEKNLYLRQNILLCPDCSFLGGIKPGSSQRTDLSNNCAKD